MEFYHILPVSTLVCWAWPSGIPKPARDVFWHTMVFESEPFLADTPDICQLCAKPFSMMLLSSRIWEKMGTSSKVGDCPRLGPP